MAHTTLASTDRALEKIGEFVALQDYPSLKAVGRTFVQKAGVLVGLRRSIPKYNKKGKRRLAALELQARSLESGVPARGVVSNPLHCIIFGALAERVAAAPDGSQLVEDLWNDFPHLMTSADDDAATMCGCFH